MNNLYSYFIKRFLSILFYYYNLYNLYTCINKIKLNVLFNYIVNYYVRFVQKEIDIPYIKIFLRLLTH